MMDGMWITNGAKQRVISIGNTRLLHTWPSFLANTVFAATPGSPFPVQTDSPQFYGHLWWTNRTQSGLGSAVPADAYYAWGYRETFLVVIPSLDMIVVRYGYPPYAQAGYGKQIMARVMNAVVPADTGGTTTPQAASSLSLINADTNQPIPGYDPLPSGTTLDLATLPTRNLNIRANTSPATVGSVRFALDGNSAYATDSATPYALAGDSSGNYTAWTPSVGSHSVTATPYTGAGATGTAGTPLTVAFTVTNSGGGGSGPSVASLSLMNADTNQPISGYDPLSNGATLDLTTLPTSHLNIRANTSPATVGSVRFALDGNSNYRTETMPPYAMAGDTSGNYDAWTPTVGSHTLTVTPYSGGGGTGTAGTALTVTFTVTKSAVSTPQSVTSMSLLDGNTGAVISGYASLSSGTTLDLAKLPTRNLKIQANTTPATVGSVRFALDSNSTYATDDTAPYAFASAWTPSVGSHTVKATPYTGAGATGTAGTALTIALTVTDSGGSTSQSVSSLSLLNGDTGAVISGFATLPSGTTLDLATLPTRNLKIQANTSPATVGSVRFALDSNTAYATDSTAPYTFAATWTPSVGSHTVKATPYTGSGATGTAGTALTVALTVTDSSGNGGGGDTSGPAVTSLSLMNANTNQAISELQNGMAINLASLPTTNLNVRANTTPATVGSVRFALDGNSNYRTETMPPYAMAGDTSGDYWPWTPSVGSHTLTATPYSGAGGTGTAGRAITVTFTVTKTATSTPQSVSSLSLLNGDTGAVISGYATLPSGTTLDLAKLPTRNLKIQANTSPATVGSVRFALDSNTAYATDSTAPYAFSSAWTPSVGSHTVKATPYTGSGATGTAGTALTIALTVTDSGGGNSGEGSSGPAVSSATVMNADTDQAILALHNGATLDLATLPTTNLNVRANTDPATVGSVRFALDSNGNYRTETMPPYALAGDTSGDYWPWTPSVGSHTLTITPYSGAGGTGTAGTKLTIAFTVTDSDAGS